MSPFNGKLIESIELRRRYTPDFKELKKKQAHLVFIPDELRKTYAFHPMIRNRGTYLGLGSSVSTNYLLYNAKDDGRSIFMESRPNDAAKNCMIGELYLVPLHTLCMLDGFYDNGTEFERKQIYVWGLDQKLQSKILKNHHGINPSLHAWVYLGIKDRWINNPSRTPPKLSFAIRTFNGKHHLNTGDFYGRR